MCGSSPTVGTVFFGGIMDKNTKILFNLFIMEYFGYETQDEQSYKWVTEDYDIFQIEKSCFPENEIYCHTIIVGDYRAEIDCNVIYDGIIISRS